MWSLRSFLATSRSTPSSTPLRPSFHASSTRTPYCSTVSGCVLGTISTATCAPLRDSNSWSVRSSAERCCSFSVPVRSVTRAFSGGIAICPAAIAGKSVAATSAARKSLLGEINRRRLRDGLLVLHRELRFFLEAEHLRGQVGGKRADGHVVILRCADEAIARDRDPVLLALELRLQLAEVGIRLKLRIGLRHGHEPGEGACELPL